MERINCKKIKSILIIYSLIRLCYSQTCIVQDQGSIGYPTRDNNTYNPTSIQNIQYSVEQIDKDGYYLKAVFSTLVNSSSGSSLQLRTYTLKASIDWKIVYTSAKEGCVISKQSDQVLHLAYTSLQGIEQIQTINFLYIKIKYMATNQNCSILKIIDKQNNINIFIQSKLSSKYYLDAQIVYSTTLSLAYSKNNRIIYLLDSKQIKQYKLSQQSQVFDQILKIQYSDQKKMVLLLSENLTNNNQLGKIGFIIYNLQKSLTDFSTSYLIENNKSQFTLHYNSVIDFIFLKNQSHIFDFLSIQKKNSSKNLIIDNVVLTQKQKSILQNNLVNTFKDLYLIVLQDNGISNRMIFHMLKFFKSQKLLFYMGNLYMENASDYFLGAVQNKQANNYLIKLDQQSQCLSTTVSTITYPCSNNCIKCLDINSCIQCVKGFQLFKGACIKCHSCKMCNPTSPEICRACFYPYAYNDITQSCELISCNISNCQTCLKNDICETCWHGYSLQLNNTCSPCPKNCFNCNSNTQTCSICNLGYTLIQDTCTACMPGCKQCQQNNFINCITCIDGYFSIKSTQLNNAQISTCKTCSSKCKICSSIDKCIQCNNGYQFNIQKSQCLLTCQKGCKTCEQDSIKCITCLDGFKLDSISFTCSLDLNCNQLSNCNACPLRYVLIQQINQCQKCSTTDENCIICNANNLSNCQSCSDGYFIQGVMNNARCMKCKQQCQTCYNGDSCSTCNEGYFLKQIQGDNEGQCFPCQQNCRICTQSKNNCLDCIQNYDLNGTICRSKIYLYMRIELALALNQLYLVRASLMQRILNMIQEIDPLKQQFDLNLFNVQQLSSSVKVDISINNNQSIIIKMKQNLNRLSTSSFNGIGVKSYQSKCYNTKICDKNLQSEIQSTVIMQDSSSSSSSTVTIVIVVVSSVFGLLFIVIIIFIIYQKHLQSKQKDTKQDSTNKNQNYKSRQSQGIISRAMGQIQTDQVIEDCFSCQAIHKSTYQIPQFGQLVSQIPVKSHNQINNKIRKMSESHKYYI